MLQRFFYLTFIACALFLAMTVIPAVRQSRLEKRVAGRILSQVESHGEAWYVNPQNNTRYYLGRPADAFRVMRELSVGISNTDLERLFGVLPETNESYPTVSSAMAERLAGRILLKIEGKGEAYYLAPQDRRGYYLGRPADAFRVMSSLGLGIRNRDIERISY